MPGSDSPIHQTERRLEPNRVDLGMVNLEPSPVVHPVSHELDGPHPGRLTRDSGRLDDPQRLPSIANAGFAVYFSLLSSDYKTSSTSQPCFHKKSDQDPFAQSTAEHELECGPRGGSMCTSVHCWCLKIALPTLQTGRQGPQNHRDLRVRPLHMRVPPLHMRVQERLGNMVFRRKPVHLMS